MINPEIVQIFTNVIIFIFIGVFSFKISRITKRELVNFLAKPDEFEKDIKLLILASLLMFFALLTQYIYAITVTIYFPIWFMNIVVIPGLISVLLILYVFYRWYKRAGVMK